MNPIDKIRRFGFRRKAPTPANPRLRCPWCKSSNVVVISQEVRFSGQTQYELSCRDCANGRIPFTIVDPPEPREWVTAIEGD